MLRNNKAEIVNLYNNGWGTKDLAKRFCCSRTMINDLFRDIGIITDPRKKHLYLYPKILKMYQDGQTAYSIAKELGINVMCICRALHSFGLDISSGRRQHSGGPLKECAAKIIVDYLKGEGCTILSRKYKCGEPSIIKILKKNNIEIRENRQNFCNEDFFEKIDVPEKAYWLGFFYADGCNLKNTNGISIALTDKDSIDKLIRCVDYRGYISIYSPRKQGHKTQYCWRYCSKKMSDDLAKAGCGPRKTYTLQFPSDDQVPGYVLKYWLLGLQDGDGTITANYKRNAWFVRIVGTKHLCEGIKDYVARELDVYCGCNKVYTNPKTGFEVWRFEISDNANVKKYLDWIYDDAVKSMWMDRKYLKYKEFLNRYKAKA